MKLTCEQTEKIVDRWEVSGDIRHDEYEALSAHLVSCDNCRSRFAEMVLFIGRDAGVGAALPVEEIEPGKGFVQAVFDRLSARRLSFAGGSQHSFRGVAARWALVAAAALVLVLAGAVFRTQLFGADRTEMVVHFVLDAPGAQRVALVGNFTAWNPDKLFLRREGDSSRWEISVPLKRGETYLYNFVIDGKTWIPDPSTEIQVTDGFGGESSLIQL